MCSLLFLSYFSLPLKAQGLPWATLPVVGLRQFLSQGSVGTESFLVARRVDMSRSSERLLQGDSPSFKAPRAVLRAPGWY